MTLQRFLRDCNPRHKGGMDMVIHTVIVNLPAHVYERVKQQAQDKNRSVEDELTAVVETAVSLGEEWVGVSPDLAEEAAQLALLNDHHVWRLAWLAGLAEEREAIHHERESRDA